MVATQTSGLNTPNPGRVISFYQKLNQRCSWFRLTLRMRPTTSLKISCISLTNAFLFSPTAVTVRSFAFDPTWSIPASKVHNLLRISEVNHAKFSSLISTNLFVKLRAFVLGPSLNNSLITLWTSPRYFSQKTTCLSRSKIKCQRTNLSYFFLTITPKMNYHLSNHRLMVFRIGTFTCFCVILGKV